MNFMGKSGGSGEEKEDIQQAPTLGSLLLSSSSSYHHHQSHNNHHHGGWLVDYGEPPSWEQNEEGVWNNMMVEREHMFDKAVTPSDVGKLNRLVIPKQHAERFFPLDSSTNYKGLLLNFEDRNGKLWRFQYSYWNSSQSYVMTKGWSRFVKDKKLDAGDIVSFQRGVGVTAKDRLFIDWRRRVINPSTPPHQLPASSDLSFLFQNHNFIHPCNNIPLVLQSFPARRNPNFMLQTPPNINLNRTTSSRSIYFGQGGFESGAPPPLGLGFDPPPPPPAASAAAPPVNGKRRLRLFGVNMDCVFSEDGEDQDQDYEHEHEHDDNPSEINHSSSSTIPYLQLRPWNQSTILSSASSAAHDDLNIIPKSTVSNMSLDLKM